MNKSNSLLGGTAAQGVVTPGYANTQSVPVVERKPELIRAFGEYENLLEHVVFNINQLEERLAPYCSRREEKNEASPCTAPFTSGAAASLANTNNALGNQIRRLEYILSILEL